MIREELASGEPGLNMGVIFEEIIDLQTGAIMGHEVLTRIATRPSRITPEMWFAKARTMGVAARLEARAAEIALHVLPPGDGLISVNFSPDTLEAPEVIRALDALAGIGRPAVVELSEHHHVNKERLARSLVAIRERGLFVAVDDAGKGESSPEFVREVLPEIIKIDRKHISQIDRSPAQRMVLHSYVQLADVNDAYVVTEGVASSRVLNALGELGSQWGLEFLGQGYWLSKSRLAAARLSEAN